MSSFDVTSNTKQRGAASATSVTSTVIVTGTSFLFCACRTSGLAVTLEITGCMVSATVTSKSPEDVLPNLSFAMHCTVVVPSGKVEPDDGSHVICGSGSDVPSAVTVNVIAAPSGDSASAVMSS